MSEKPTPLCDTCAKPHLPDQGICTLASKYDDDGDLVSFRHWDCHEREHSLEALRKKTDTVMRRATELLNDLRRRGIR